MLAWREDFHRQARAYEIVIQHGRAKARPYKGNL
jgi:hypothetical protein